MTALDYADLLPAEQKLIAAAVAGEPCNLIDPAAAPTHDAITAWSDPDREIRASILTQLITNRFHQVRLKKIEVRGAIVRGAFVCGPVDIIDFQSTYSLYQTFDVTGATFTGSAVFCGVTFTEDARFEGATFTQDAVFTRATFTQDAVFTGATFTENAVFEQATFTQAAEFREATFTQDAAFGRVKFTEIAVFGEARFTGSAWFTRATFIGSLWFMGATFIESAVFEKATFTQDADFSGATFTQDADFSGATFTEIAVFSWATFTENADFSGATFTENALFEKATFTENALFEKATFTQDAAFGRVKFTEIAVFGEARFTGSAWFAGATFTKDAVFEKATFTENAVFEKATFTKNARFTGVTFTEITRFTGVTFTESAFFDEATFGKIDLRETVVGEGSFRRTTFNGPVDGAWAARAVAFDEARFTEPITLQLLCPMVSLANVELQSRGTLQMRGGIDGTAATFGGRTTLADPGAEEWGEWLPGALNQPELADQLLPLLDPKFRSTVSSLRRATVTDLELAAVDLTDCRFEGAHGLDKMRMNSICVLPATPEDLRVRRPMKFTHREVIAEEKEWRKRFASWGPGEGQEIGTDPAVDESVRKDADNTSPDTTTIAGIYRALRKGREDSSDAPGAADFYYGEMEMRRLARREWRKRGNDVGDGSRKPSLAEHWLLTAYWAVSGYGLRAWRAIAAVIAVIAVATVVFATVGVEDPPGVTERVAGVQPISGQVSYEQISKAPFGWWESFELAARNSVALLRNPGNIPSLTPIGTITDVALRLLVPVLLALAVLAIRGRTKR